MVENGLYYLKADIPNLTYSLAPITSIGMVGAESWEKSDVEFTQVDYWTWRAEYTFASDNQEWKLWMNNGWDFNLGGSYDNLVQNGANLKAPGAGSYILTLDLSTIPYSISATPK